MAKKTNHRSAKYWSNRMDEIMLYVDRTDIDFFDELQTIYTESRQSVQKEIYAFYAQYAKENKISLQEAKKRLMREELSDYRMNAEKYLKQVEKDLELLKWLNEQYRAGKVTRLEALQLDLAWQLGKMSGTLHQSFDSYLKEVAKYAYRKIAGGNSQSTLNKPALEQIVKTPFNGKNYSDSIWGNIDDLAKDLKKVLTQGFIRGSGPADMARELRKTYNVAKSRAEAIVRTDGTNVINLSAVKRFEEFGLTRYKNNVHVDSRTTDICLQVHREDKSYLLSEYQPGVTAPPYHVNCRTGIVPDDSELGFEEKDVKN
ncbi:minor capsid protein [Enterococcus canintestini]|uniref:Head protein n=1 Tax=Enterococcus canintestini TaxID=317010 RepID=A0A267HRW7_9ENTE|nr:minor capsid protein [Enterococcus canintestini]PAB01101.1 head protein [Enterococcus canintestini]